MTEVKFEDGGPVTSTGQFENKDPYFVALLIKFGLAKDTKQAVYLLMGFAIMGILISIVIFWSLKSSSSGPEEIPPDILRQMSTPHERNRF